MKLMHGKGKIFKKKHEWRMINDKQKKKRFAFLCCQNIFFDFFCCFFVVLRVKLPKKVTLF